VKPSSCRAAGRTREKGREISGYLLNGWGVAVVVLRGDLMTSKLEVRALVFAKTSDSVNQTGRELHSRRLKGDNLGGTDCHDSRGGS